MPIKSKNIFSLGTTFSLVFGDLIPKRNTEYGLVSTNDIVFFSPFYYAWNPIKK